ncbi:hypothetical protein ACTQ49_08410 [Luteococcus sp. Sow4_B9]|uniref:hypothetical protein n=1 Tax=Luteococcus sp. Sow4_B9 TaxID=3438792 RepID=UPI003F98BDF8
MSDQPRPPQGQYAAPLLPTDPPRVGPFWLDARLVAGPPGVAYLAHGTDPKGASRQVMLVILAEGAARDAAARERLAGEVNKLHIDTVVARGGEGQDQGRLGHRYVAQDDHPVPPDAVPQAPWVALAHDGSEASLAEAERLLRSVDLSMAAPIGDVAGPDYRLHWIDDSQPPANRAWPLPWPGRPDRAGWMSIAVSWLLTLLLSALALLIAVLLFQNKPPAPPPPPIPTTPPPSDSSQSPPPSQSQTPPPSQSQSPSQGSGSPSPESGSSSPSDASASPSQGSQSASPSQSASGEPTNPSHNPSMESPMPSGSASGEGGTPTPNRRL